MQDRSGQPRRRGSLDVAAQGRAGSLDGRPPARCTSTSRGPRSRRTSTSDLPRADEFGASATSKLVTWFDERREPPMPTRDSAPIGAPCWVDLMTTDVEGSRAFYGELFGWTSEEPNEQFGGYFTFSKDGVQVAGGMASQPGMGVPNVWSIYLASDDAAKTLEAVTANGGQIYAEAIQVMDLGTMAVAADPGGAAIAVWQPGSHKGFGIFAEVGAPSWFELLTRDYATSVDFYREVF